MPMPIRSSEWNISRAWVLVRDMDSSILTEGGAAGQMPKKSFNTRGHRGSQGNSSLLVAPVLDDTQHGADHCQSDQNRQRRFVVSGKETQDMVAIVESERGGDGVANAATESEGGEKLFSRVLHGPCCQQERDEGKWRRQQGRNCDRAESPAGKGFAHFR